MKSCWALLLVGVLFAACEEPKPSITGRLEGPTDMVLFRGCPQFLPDCDEATEARHLLLVVNSLANDLKVFDVEGRSFFTAPNPLFPLNIPVGEYPRSLILDPFGEYAFVANGVSEDVSIVDLANDRLVEVDTDGDPCTSFCGRCDDPDGTDLNDERCDAGVSRTSLDTGTGPLPLPDDIVAPRSMPGLEDEPWDRDAPLPVYVSLSGSGQVAVLHFTYPDPDSGTPHTLEVVDVLDVGGQPSGMAITDDGSLLFVGDEVSPEISIVDTVNSTIEKVDVGGSSRRLSLTPDQTVLYVVRLEPGRLSLVDVETRTRMAPGIPDNQNAILPVDDPMDLKVPGIPRDVAFVQGVTYTVTGSDFEPKEWTTELLTAEELAAKLLEDQNYTEHVVKTFAFISNMDGSVYIADGENHRLVDMQAYFGPSVGDVLLYINNESLSVDDLNACVGTADCPYPHLAEYDAIYDGENETRRVYHGVFVQAGQTRQETWFLTYQGVLPGTGHSTSGRFVSWRLEDDREGLDFLSATVSPGDVLEILLDPSSDEPACENISPEFEILTVEEKALGLREREGAAPSFCWTQALRYQVRVGGDAWLVRGELSGVHERLQMIPFEEPVQEPYNNGLISFILYEPGIDPETGERYPIARDTFWAFATDDGFFHAAFSPSVQAGVAGAILSVDVDAGAAEENEGDDRVFVLFEASNALIEFFPTSLESSNFLLYQ